jgi:hypothetical protein
MMSQIFGTGQVCKCHARGMVLSQRLEAHVPAGCTCCKTQNRRVGGGGGGFAAVLIYGVVDVCRVCPVYLNAPLSVQAVFQCGVGWHKSKSTVYAVYSVHSHRFFSEFDQLHGSLLDVG